ncbi:MAG: hypothetical protein HFH68_06075 [Lachnospiraceae bacterium]|nr:hypothetical protein [Lachnospiraceae bacterium]
MLYKKKYLFISRRETDMAGIIQILKSSRIYVKITKIYQGYIKNIIGIIPIGRKSGNE